MKSLRIMAAVASATLVAGGLLAAPSVEITNVQQQYPWTNTVDITYQVQGVSDFPSSQPNDTYFATYEAKDSSGNPIADVNGNTVFTNALINGSKTDTAQWQPAKDLQLTGCTMTPSVFRGEENAYMIVDLATGAVTYEPMSTQEASNKRYNDDDKAGVYKTTKMVFRRVKAGNYPIQCGQKTATMAKDYYIAIFQLTTAQYNLIMGSGATTSKVPISAISWNHVRGSALATADVVDTGSGPLAKLNAKVHEAGNANLQFDLPTEAMWEVAARANCPADWQAWWGSHPYNSVDSLGRGISHYARWRSNSSGKVEVGTRAANPWGLYDMLGSLWEYCRDCTRHWQFAPATIVLTDLSVTQTPSNTGDYAMIRGGQWADSWTHFLSCRDSDRTKNSANSCDGFRFAMIAK